MNGKQTMEELLATLVSWVRDNADTAARQCRLMRRIFDGAAGALLEGAPDAMHISAPNAVVEVVDTQSGRLYRRYLELSYDETDNGLRLLGEDIKGIPTQLVFLSNTAIERIHDIRGQGPDKPRCKDE